MGLTRIRRWILVSSVIRAGFLDEAIRAELMALMRDGKEEMRTARRANAVLLLDDGTSRQAIAEILYMDDAPSGIGTGCIRKRE